jgi:hypothetical protein
MALAGTLLLGAPAALHAQGAGESLGATDNPGAVGPSPIAELMRSLHSSLKPELMGVHPRVYFTDSELDALRARAHGQDAVQWQQVLAHLRVLQGPPTPSPAQKRRAQNDVALAIAEGAFAFQMEHDPKILAATERYMDAAVSYPVWGYSFSKPNIDLGAAHLLYGLGLAYDLLYHDLTPAQRDRYRAKLALQGHLMYEAFAPRPGRRWAYSQNHTFIPMAGLAVAAYAVYGEVPEAAQWAALSRAIYSRTLATYSKDGYYYEGYEYWIFATPWIIHYLDVARHAAGDDLFDQPGLRLMHLYAAHALLPGGQSVFDFGDVYDGPETRARKGNDYERSHPGGHFETNYNLLYDLARRFQSPDIEGIADWMKSLGQTSQEEWWTLAWRDPHLASTPIAKFPPYHFFPDHGVAFWRTGWDAQATAVAFKCGPPEGHADAAYAAAHPDWRLEDGHTHPDVNSFILFAHGQYLTGVSGYAGVPRTIGSNTLLVDGHGQAHEGKGHDAWAGTPYAQLNHIHMVSAKLDSSGFDLVGEGAAAYDATLGLQRFDRSFRLVGPGEIEVDDHISAAIPSRFTEVLHTDTTFLQSSGLHFSTTVGGHTLHVTADAPAGSEAKIEANEVMGPGRPGSVDKGTLEQRGERLLIVTPAPVKELVFRWKLSY